MPHPRFSSEEVCRRGEELYAQSIRSKVETEENIGRLVAIDIETGDYAVGDVLLETGDPLRDKRPESAIYVKRIGYKAVYSIGGGSINSLDGLTSHIL